MSACWCQSGKPASHCCAPFLSGEAYPETCEALMRSRYSAFVTENATYLKQTWVTKNCPANITFDPDCRWLGLKIKHTVAGGSEDSTGTVHFVARYKVAGKAYRIDENSHFIRQNNQWVYDCAIEH